MNDNLAIARELEAMAQTGLHFAEDRYNRDRYTRLREIALFDSVKSGKRIAIYD